MFFHFWSSHYFDKTYHAILCHHMIDFRDHLYGPISIGQDWFFFIGFFIYIKNKYQNRVKQIYHSSANQNQSFVSFAFFMPHILNIFFFLFLSEIYIFILGHFILSNKKMFSFYLTFFYIHVSNYLILILNYFWIIYHHKNNDYACLISSCHWSWLQKSFFLIFQDSKYFKWGKI